MNTEYLFLKQMYIDIFLDLKKNRQSHNTYSKYNNIQNYFLLFKSSFSFSLQTLDLVNSFLVGNIYST